MTDAFHAPLPAGSQYETSSISPGIFAVITALFILSGATGLVYQVLWMRSLGLFFGSDIFAISIILSTFMGGLAVGSFAGGHLAERVNRPLLWYGIAEAGIGCFALQFRHLLDLSEPILRSVYSNAASASFSYELVRTALAAGILLIPTALMGATLPLILRHFVRTGSGLGRMAAHFYGFNTLGAMLGTLVAGFVLLPNFGMANSTAVVATVNLLIGVSCVVVGIYARPALDLTESGGDVETLPDVVSIQRERVARAALLAFGVSGFGSFALEVIWTRSLLMSASATVYSFASMLVCFLFGIFFGSFVISRAVDRASDPLRLFSQLELGIAAYVGGLCLLTNALPRIFGAVFAQASVLQGGSGAALVIATLATSFFLLLVPTMLLGATFSVALRAYTSNVAQIGTRTGYLYFSNTLGAILGSLCAGFLLIPTFGVKGSLGSIALLFAANGLYLAWRQRERMGQPAMGLAAVALVAAGVGVSMPYQVTMNFNQRAGSETELLYHAEGIQNTIDVVRSASGATALIIGGNVEADDSIDQLRHFILKGHLPLMLIEEPRKVLVVGLGMGITLNATVRHEGLERVDVVELSPEILDAQEVLKEINGDVRANPKIHVRIDDGRNYLRMTTDSYDMITADPIHPKIARVGYLYTKEYYESIRSHLGPGGVVCQWMPLYQISPRRLRSAMKTFVEVFPHATLWYVKNHALFLAKVDSPMLDYRLLARNFELASVREDFGRIGIDSAEELLMALVMGPAEIEAFVGVDPDVPLNTDDYPYLEYGVPGDLYYRPIDNVSQFVPHLVDPTDLVTNLPAEAATRIERLVDGRGQRLLDELS